VESNHSVCVISESYLEGLHTFETTYTVPNVVRCLMYNIGFRKWSCDGIRKEWKESICRLSSHICTNQPCPV